MMQSQPAGTINSTQPERDAAAYRPDIDGLRAIAVLSVVLFHASAGLVNGGFVGVDIFFVISGYLIGAHVYAETSRGRFSIAEFYRRRAKRILPALLLLLAVCSAIAYFLFTPFELAFFARYAIATILSISNIIAWKQTSYFSPDSSHNSLLMTWSLGVEEQFYLVFPLIMLALAKWSRRQTALTLTGLGLISFVSCILISQRDPSTAFYLFPFRAWELLLGVLLAVHQDRGRPVADAVPRWLSNLLAVSGSGLLAFSILGFGPQTIFPGYAAAAPCLGALLLIASPASWINRRVLSLLPFTFIGQISYSLYLWHWPLLSFAHIATDQPLSRSAGCIIAAASVLIAWASFRFVEQPFRRSTTPRRRLFIRYALCCAIVMLPALVFRVSAGLPRRFAALSQGALLGRGVDDRRCAVDYGEPSAPILSKECVDSDDPRPAVALIGDSHAAAIAGALREDAARAGFKFYEMVKFGCHPLQGVTYSYQLRQWQSDCIRYNQQALSILRADPRVRLVVIAGDWSSPETAGVSYVRAGQSPAGLTRADSDMNFADGLAGTVGGLVSAGKQVLLIKDVPIFVSDPIGAIRQNSIPLRSFVATGHFPDGRLAAFAPLSQTQLAAEQHADAVLDRVARSLNARTFDPRPNLCDPAGCRYLDGTLTLYTDQDHLTETGARQALKGLDLSR